MIDAPLAFAFAAGIVAAFNPCGFAMLPAYLSAFLSSEQRTSGDTAPPVSLARAARVAVSVSVGFALVFGVVGILVVQLSLGVQRVAPWFTAAIGVLLAVGGVAMLAGWRPGFRVPVPGRARGGRDMAGMFVFGVSYAFVSLSCTLPVFLAASAGVLARRDLVSGLGVFAAYASGMALVLVSLTVVVALARRSLVSRMGGAVAYVNRASGAILVASGGYLTWFGYVELRQGAGSPIQSAAVSWVTRMSGAVVRGMDAIGTTRLALLLGLVLIAVATARLILTLGRRLRPESQASTATTRAEAEHQTPRSVS